ncbi:hypothetical protein LIER_27220 [Lithospermum erythrorhizon]|uniref:Uncharacterized protein n=1 Tax=Lithospermum erythrorhizon TaxID=34254 RepID=A0AAV3REV3_LITER
MSRGIDNNGAPVPPNNGDALCAKEKLGFIDGRLLEPDVVDPTYDRWKRIDCIVSSWILNSISTGMEE